MSAIFARKLEEPLKPKVSRQKSFIDEKPTLYLVATPIGNLSDFSERAIETLASVDMIFAEDTRVSQHLLNHYKIETPIKSYHEHNKQMAGETIIALLDEGKSLALISDAGTPVISDPGFEIVQSVIEHEFYVVAIPGANAAISALIVSGIAPQPFTFFGFLAATQSKRLNQLTALKNHVYTMIFYESPHRIKEMLNDMLIVFGNRQIALAREITKKFEEIIRGEIEDVLPYVDSLKGEIVVVVDGNQQLMQFEHISVVQHVNLYIESGIDEKEAIKRVAKERQIKKQEVYIEYQLTKPRQ